MWSVLSIKLWYWPAKSCDQREGSGKFIKRENQECSRTWTVLAQHEPNQTYMEDNCEVSMKLFIIWASLIYPLPPWVHVPKLVGHNCPTKMVLPLRPPARNWQCYGASPSFYTPWSQTGLQSGSLVQLCTPVHSLYSLYCSTQPKLNWAILLILLAAILNKNF